MTAAFCALCCLEQASDETAGDPSSIEKLCWRAYRPQSAVYRQACEARARAREAENESQVITVPDRGPPIRKRLPVDRDSVTKKLELHSEGGGYATVGKYEDGTPGEIFLVVDRAGTTARGSLDAVALACSMELQSGVAPWAVFGRFLSGRDETGGAGSVVATVLDLAARWVFRKFPDSRAVLHEFRVGQTSGLLLVGLDDAGRPMGLRVAVDAVDPSARDAMRQVSDLVSELLRIGVPLKILAEKFIGGRFEPSGFTGYAAVPNASSVLDYVFRFVYQKFHPDEYAKKYGSPIVATEEA